MKDVKIGLETHVQLNTDSKMFCGCSNKKGGEPNSRTCPVCLGHPGSRPKVNQKVIEEAVKVSLALDCEIAREFRFSRKNYFYPDLSKNYQITQYESPVGQDGELTFSVGDEDCSVRIKRLHMEEDPAKIEHSGSGPEDSEYTLVDYNRSGTPLLEIVTKPDLNSPKQAAEYLNTLAEILEYLEIWSPESGFVLKSDANISIEGGSRVEIKNITGKSGIKKALSYEISRQKQLKKRGREVEQETRNYDSSQEITTPLREKEEEADYGYIVEPDLTGQEFTDEKVSELGSGMPELPQEKKQRIRQEYQVSEELVESLTTSKKMADDFEKLCGDYSPELVARWMTGDLLKVLNFNDLTYRESPVNLERASTILDYLSEDKITERNAEMVLRKVVENDLDPQEVVESENLLKAGGSDLDDFVEEVIDENQEAVEDYHSGDEGALNFLVGQVMQRSNGRTDPKETRNRIEEVLEDSS